MKIRANHNRKGFSLLLAVLVGSLLISVALGIFGLTFKGSIITTSGKDSQIALYAADTAIECALYYDVSEVAGNKFPIDTADASAVPVDNLKCNNSELPTVLNFSRTVNGPAKALTFTLHYVKSGNGFLCADVTINKTQANADAQILTRMDARGYNTCNPSNPRRVERGLFIKYP